MTTAVKLFLKQSVLTRSIPFELKLDSDYENELEDKESISKYKNEGITKSTAIGRMKKSIRASFSFITNFQPLRPRYRPDRQRDLFLKKSSAIMFFVRGVRGQYQTTQEPKKENGDKK